MCIYIQAIYACGHKSPDMYETCRDSFSSGGPLSPLCDKNAILNIILWHITGPCPGCYWIGREKAYNVCPPLSPQQIQHNLVQTHRNLLTQGARQHYLSFLHAAEAHPFRRRRFAEAPLYCGPGEGNLIKHHVPYNLRLGKQPSKLTPALTPFLT